MIECRILVVIALMAEAKALLSLGKWKRLMIAGSRKQAYQRIDKPMSLIVSGSGKLASAIATTQLIHVYKNTIDQLYLINIGSCAARNKAVGELIDVLKITDSMNDRRWYIQHQFKFKLANDVLETVNQPTLNLPHIGVIDMEASGFIEAATQAISLEKIVMLKVVSDNTNDQYVSLTADKVTAIIKSVCEQIEKCFDDISQYAKKHSQDNKYFELNIEDWLAGWHWTLTRQRQLIELLKDIRLLSRQSSNDLLVQCKDLNNASQVLMYLKTKRAKLSDRVLCV